MNDKTNTLFGYKPIQVGLEDAAGTITPHEWTVRQIKVREYQLAFQLIDDEIGLIAIACNQKRSAVESLIPESYTLAWSTLEEVNKDGFFIFAERQKERAAKAMERLPADLLARTIEANRSTSSMPSPHIPPPRG